MNILDVSLHNVTENDSAVLVRYEVCNESPRNILTRFVNELTLRNLELVEVMSNFDVENTYTKKINNFELELYGDLKPNDIGYIYPGWGTPVVINQMSYGLEIVWKDLDHPIPPGEERHFGVTIDPNKDHIRALGYLTIETAKGEDEDAAAELDSTMPKNKPFNLNPFFIRFLEQHPNLFPVLRQLIGL